MADIDPHATIVDFLNVQGLIETVTSIPAHVPGKLDQQIKLYVDSIAAPTTVAIYLYSNKTNTWLNFVAGGTPGGSNTQLQFNNSGAFGGAKIKYTQDLSDVTYPENTLTGTASIDTSGLGGEFNVNGGNGTGAGDGQRIYLNGGKGGATGDGGEIGITGGSGGSTSGNGGQVTIYGGLPDFANSAEGVGGTVQIGAGASNNDSAGANLELYGGDGHINGTGTGNGGDIILYPGIAGSGGVTGAIMVAGQYYSDEFDCGNITGTATIDWTNGNVQYATMTGDVTLTFTNPRPGARYLLHLAGAFTPTFPSSVRWSGGVAATATAASGKKDLYTIIYSGKESLYDILQSPNYAIT